MCTFRWHRPDARSLHRRRHDGERDGCPGIGDLIAGNLPIAVRLVFSVGLQVLLMTYVIMPRVTRLLAKWLFRSFPA